MENNLKRKRTPNFPLAEKLRFVRLLREEGHCIVSKVAAHDSISNKEKEQAWKKITKIHNSSEDTMRTTENLKKLWCKLKYEAKTYKAARRSVSGTGPSKELKDPVLELVIETTGRASKGTLNVDECDAEMTENENADSPGIEYVNLLEDFVEERITDMKEDPDMEVEDELPADNLEEKRDRRRPNINAPDEMASKIKSHQRISNKLAAERLRAEQEKSNLINQQIKHNEELHAIKMKNEKLKNNLLQILIKKVLDADNKDVNKFALRVLFESQ